jgi:hypothetical protein
LEARTENAVESSALVPAKPGNKKSATIKNDGC